MIRPQKIRQHETDHVWPHDFRLGVDIDSGVSGGRAWICSGLLEADRAPDIVGTELIVSGSSFIPALLIDQKRMAQASDDLFCLSKIGQILTLNKTIYTLTLQRIVFGDQGDHSLKQRRWYVHAHLSNLHNSEKL